MKMHQASTYSALQKDVTTKHTEVCSTYVYCGIVNIVLLHTAMCYAMRILAKRFFVSADFYKMWYTLSTTYIKNKSK